MTGVDYNQTGVYFITVCTAGRRCMLSFVHGLGESRDPKLTPVGGKVSLELTAYGTIVDETITRMNETYPDVQITNYVIMPNHVHLLIFIKNAADNTTGKSYSGCNSTISRHISTFKRFVNKQIGENIWQSRSYDHIIRGNDDLENHVSYINSNPINWYNDEMYCE